MATQNKTSNTTDIELLLRERNDQMAVSMIPAIIYLVVLLVIGVLGNLLVLYFYGRKVKKTSCSVFICVLAVYDLCACSVSIPIEIIDLRYFYMFSNVGACKVVKYFNHTVAFGSALTLTAIATDRFKRIFRPFKQQLNIVNSKRVCFLLFVLAMLYSIPVLLIYKPVKSDLQGTDGVQLFGFDCATNKDKTFKYYILIFRGTNVVIFLAISVVLCYFYIVIGRVIYRQGKFRSRAFPVVAFTTTTGTTQIESVKNDDATGIESEKLNTEGHNVSNNRTTKNARLNVDSTNIRNTLMMLTITAVFIFSFFPYFLLQIWQLFAVDYYSYYTNVGYQVGMRSFFLNSVLNPLIYGFFNSEFRGLFKRTFCKKKSLNNIIMT